MNQRIRTSLAASWLWLLALVAMTGCGTTSTWRVSGKAPGFEGEIEWEIESGRNGEPRVVGQGDKELAGLCATVTFTDDKGNETGSSTHTLDATGGFSVEIPGGSRHMAAVIQDCPEEEEEAPGGQNGEFAPSEWSGAVQPSTDGASGRLKAPLARTRVLVIPVSLDFGPGVEHHFISLEVTGPAAGNSMAVARSLLDHGLDSRIPASVQVLEFLTVEPDDSGGARLRSATKSQYLSWMLDANNGAWTADLFGSSIRYDHADWDVVETLVPASALDLGSMPGVTYANQLSVRFRTTAKPSTSRTSLELEAQI